jgi:hypothetical protein
VIANLTASSCSPLETGASQICANQTNLDFKIKSRQNRKLRLAQPNRQNSDAKKALNKITRSLAA